MKKLFILIMAVAMTAAAVPAMATEARVEALGPYTANYIEDDYNVFGWYGTLPSYANIMTIGLENDWEYDYWQHAYFGLTYGLGDENEYGVIGMVFLEDMYGPNIYGWAGDWPDDELFDTGITNRYTIMYGKELESMSFGLMFSYSSEKFLMTETDVDDFEVNGKYITFGAGARFDINEEMTADIAADMTMCSYADSGYYSGVPVEKNDGMAMQFKGRIFYEYSKDLTFVPFATYRMGNYSLTPATNSYYGGPNGFKDMLFKLGVAANITVNEDNMILFAIEPFSYWKGEPSQYADDYDGTIEITALTLPRFLLALETDVTDWMTFRIGCSKSLTKYKLTDTYAGDETVYELYTGRFWETFEWNLGLGFHYGDFDIDCLISKDLPFAMGYWLTGYQPDPSDDMTPIGMVTALYHF